LNLAYADFGSTSGPDFIATFEVVLTNPTAHRINNLSIEDSLMGLKSQIGGPVSGGELRPYFTNVDVLDTSSTLVPLPFNSIIANNGQLLNVAISYLAPSSITRLLVRIGGRGFLISENPATGAPGATERSKITTLLQSSCEVNGDIVLCGNKTVKMFPLYCRTGMLNGFNMNATLFDATTIPNVFDL
jgi:hypothetical protein